MFKVGRVCIPLGQACNFKCKYCFREIEHEDIPLELNDLMKWYLQNITNDWCKAVVMSGGEPLLYWEKIVAIRKLVKRNVMVTVMSNGSLLTEDIVRYMNSHNMELALSHDGAETEYLRGRDVLKDERILNLVKRVHSLTIIPVITNRNCDVMKVYKYISQKLQRDNFYFLHGMVMSNGYNQDLIDGFDYDLYGKSYREFVNKYHKTTFSRYLAESNHCSFNVDLHGNVVNKLTLHKYGTVLDSYEYCEQQKHELYKDGYCVKSNCPLLGQCTYLEEYADKHNCMGSMIRSGYI